MEIEKIIYHTTREVTSVEDKLRIAVVFLFCYKIGDEKFSELLYCKNHEAFIHTINDEYLDYDVDFFVDFSNPNIKSAFYKTLEKVKEKWDEKGFYKALYEGDEFAKAICQITNFDIYKFDKPKINDLKKQIARQLELFV